MPAFAGKGPAHMAADAMLKHLQTRVTRFEDLYPDVRTHIAAEIGSGHIGALELDMDGDGYADLAVLVRVKKQDSEAFEIYRCRDACRKIQTIDMGPFSPIAYLTELPVGTTVTAEIAFDGSGHPASVVLAHPAVALNYWGKRQYVYYWDSASRTIKKLTVDE
jgi:hypothetical protein